MLTVPQPPRAEQDDRILIAVVPVEGWWLVLDVHRADRVGHPRVKVAAWAQFTGAGGWTVEALVAGDGDQLVAVSDVYGPEWGGRLWHDGESWCGCNVGRHDPSRVDDIDWCESCGGVIAVAS